MSYLPRLEKASSAAKEAVSPLADGIEQIGTLRGLFLGGGGGSPVTMESALRTLKRARYWINTAIEEAERAEAGMPAPVNPADLINAGLNEAVQHARGDGDECKVTPFRVVNARPRPIDYPLDDGPGAA